MKLSIDLFDKQSIDAAIKKIDAMQKEVKSDLAGEAVQKGADLVREELNMAVYSQTNGGYPRTGSLMSSVNGRLINPNFGQVRVDDEAGYWVEYGTGLMGQNWVQHPELPAGYAHGTGPMVDEFGGWIYKDKNGNFYSTFGEVGRPFFYRATKRLKEWAEMRLGNLFND